MEPPLGAGLSPFVLTPTQTVPDQKNKLYYGDNFEVLQRYVKDETVDLVYLDPPFNSRQDYNVLFAEKDGSQSSSPGAPTDRSSSVGSRNPCLRRHLGMEPRRPARLRANRRAGRSRSRRPGRLQDLPLQLRQDGLPRQDGPPPG